MHLRFFGYQVCVGVLFDFECQTVNVKPLSLLLVAGSASSSLLATVDAPILLLLLLRLNNAFRNDLAFDGRSKVFVCFLPPFFNHASTECFVEVPKVFIG